MGATGFGKGAILLPEVEATEEERAALGARGLETAGGCWPSRETGREGGCDVEFMLSAEAGRAGGTAAFLAGSSSLRFLFCSSS